MVKKFSKKKKFNILIALLLTFGVLFFGLDIAYKRNFSESDRLFEFIRKKYNYVDAEIVKIKDSNMDIITKNDSLYTINYINEELNPGDYVRMFYDGKFDDFLDIQEITVKEIEQHYNNLSYDDDILDNISKMSLEEKIGQLLLVRVPSYGKLSVINDYHIGGYILFGRDVNNKSKYTLINEIKSYQEKAKIPLIIAIDEEGGTVSRLSYNYNIVKSPFKSPQALYKSGGFEAIKNDGMIKMSLLNELGINMNLAPVADLVTNKNAYMYNRSIGLDGEGTAKFINTVMSTQLDNVSYVLKHFPGYGNNVDTHSGIAIDDKDYSNFLSNDFLPFKEGIKSGSRAILVSHNIVSCMENVPSSISRVSHNILRNELKFKGIIITDDMDMDGLKKYDTNPYIDAILAGNNLLIVSDYDKAFNSILSAVKDESISTILIDRLVLKNLQFKSNYIK